MLKGEIRNMQKCYLPNDAVKCINIRTR